MNTLDNQAVGRICAVLSHPTRRAVLARLRDTEVSNLQAVSEELDGARTRSPDRRRLDVELHHVHLPMLADAGLVEYDARSGSIRTDGRVEAAYDLLDVVAAAER